METGLTLQKIGVSRFSRWNSRTFREKLDGLLDEPPGNGALLVQHHDDPIAVVIPFQTYLSWQEKLRTRSNLEMGS